MQNIVRVVRVESKNFIELYISFTRTSDQLDKDGAPQYGHASEVRRNSGQMWRDNGRALQCVAKVASAVRYAAHTVRSW